MLTSYDIDASSQIFSNLLNFLEDALRDNLITTLKTPTYPTKMFWTNTARILLLCVCANLQDDFPSVVSVCGDANSARRASRAALIRNCCAIRCYTRNSKRCSSVSKAFDTHSV